MYKLRGGIKLYVRRDQEYITGLMRNKLRVGGEGLRYKTGMCLTLQAKNPKKKQPEGQGPKDPLAGWRGTQGESLGQVPQALIQP